MLANREKIEGSLPRLRAMVAERAAREGNTVANMKADSFDFYPAEGGVANMLKAPWKIKPTPPVTSLQLVSAAGDVVASLTLREGENVFRVTKDGDALWIRNNQS